MIQFWTVKSSVEGHSLAPDPFARQNSQPVSAASRLVCLHPPSSFPTYKQLISTEYMYRSINLKTRSHQENTSKHFTMSEESEYVTLISSDGYSFIVQRSSACISGAIKRMLDPSCMLQKYHTHNHLPS